MKKPTAILADLKRKETSAQRTPRYRVRVGMATCGISAGAGRVYDAFVEALDSAGITDVDVISTGCVGRCDLEPMAEVMRGSDPPVLYIRLDSEKVKRIVDEHLAAGRVVEEYAE